MQILSIKTDFQINEENRRAMGIFLPPWYSFNTAPLERLSAYTLLAMLTGTGLHFVKGKNDKPYLIGGPYFSISHTRGAAVCAVSDHEVGSDIERQRDIYAPDRIFNKTEYTFWKHDFTQLWTIKESCVKCSGGGVSEISSFEILMNEHGGVCTGREGFYAYELHTFDGYRASVCSKSEEPLNHRVVSAKKILEFVSSVGYNT